RTIDWAMSAVTASRRDSVPLRSSERVNCPSSLLAAQAAMTRAAPGGMGSAIAMRLMSSSSRSRSHSSSSSGTKVTSLPSRKVPKLGWGGPPGVRGRQGVQDRGGHAGGPGDGEGGRAAGPFAEAAVDVDAGRHGYEGVVRGGGPLGECAPARGCFLTCDLHNSARRPLELHQVIVPCLPAGTKSRALDSVHRGI